VQGLQYLNGGIKLEVKVTLRNPLDHADQFDYYIVVQQHQLAQDWAIALKRLLQSAKPIEKNFCFMGFPRTARTLDYLCKEMNSAIAVINLSFEDYQITEHFTPKSCLSRDWADNGPNHELFNSVHNHFERLQGTVSGLSTYYMQANYQTKYAIRQLNNLCHEMENLILSQRQAVVIPEWIRPSQITTWLTADRYPLKDEHRQGFVVNGYDRVLGGVYMHWAQIGKTLFEVFRDEGAPELTETVCESITHLEYYSGEFDVEWGRDIRLNDIKVKWHGEQMTAFTAWLEKNGLDPKDPKLSLGYLPLGQIDLTRSFGTDDHKQIWNMLSDHLDIYRVEVDGVAQTYDYCWTDADYQQQQIQQLRPGYDYQARQAHAVA
jgi:hypothetical protein